MLENEPTNLQKVWNDCLSAIRSSITSQSFKTWFAPIIPISLDNGELKIRVPSQFFYEWLEERYYPLIQKSLADVLGREVKLSYTTATDEHPENPRVIETQTPETSASANLSPNPRISTSTPQPPRQSNFASTHGLSPPSQLTVTSSISRLNSNLHARYTFENFIKGESNQLARAAALAVANNPGGTSFNPLVVYGGVGLGKTHLIQAIGNHVLRHDKTKRVVYISSEKFTVEFVDAIQRDTINVFSNFYRSMDLLVVDDIQFFAGKEKTQDSFFHTFNTLHQLGRQIVLSSDRPPKELKGLDERLISRFQWGLTADIQPPDLETRIAILQKKSEEDKIDLPQDVIEFIAVNVTSNIRELEGCLIGLLAKASLENKEINLDLAREVLRTVVGDLKFHITIEGIQRSVCEFFDIPEDLIRAKTRKQEVVNARQIAMYLAKELTNSSLKTIGLHFGGRDHSTVIHAYQSVEDQLKTSEKYRGTVEQIRKRIEVAGK
jgi:chromosomal replication initiator protein